MRKFFVNTLRILLKTALAASLFICAWFYLSPYFRLDHNTEGDAFRMLPENSIDVIALGSSHMQYAFDPAVFYTETGYYSYVMGSQCQPVSITYHMLEEVLKTQSPEVAVIDVFTLLPASDVCYAEGNYYVAIDEMTGMNRLTAAETVPDEQLKTQYRFDLLMNHSNWKNMDFSNIQEILNIGKPFMDYNYELGYVRQEPVTVRPTPLITYERKNRISLSDKEKKEIDDVVTLCREHQITPIFIKTPFICDQENTDKLYAVWDYLEEKDVRYIDYVHKAEELSWFIDMDGDTWHNTSWGAEIITRDLGRYAVTEKLIKSHEKQNEMEQLCRNMRMITVKSLMNKNNINIYSLLEFAAKYPCGVAVRYQGKPTTTITEQENRLLQSLGTKHDFLRNPEENYYGFFQDGKLIQESSEAFAVSFAGSEIAITYNDILIDGISQDPDPGELEIYFMADTLEWLNAVGINYSSQWFWENSCDGYNCIMTCGW